MNTPSTYAGSEEDALSCLAARSHMLAPSTLPELDAHLATCQPCAVLAADHALLGHALNDLPQPKLDLQKMAATVQDQLQQESGVRSSLQRWSTPKRVAALLTLSLVIVMATGFGAPRADLSVYPAERMASMALALLMAGLLTVFRALRPLSDSRATPWLILAIGLLLPVITQAHGTVALRCVRRPRLPGQSPRETWGTPCSRPTLGTARASQLGWEGSRRPLAAQLCRRCRA